jgi:hypothetical protein
MAKLKLERKQQEPQGMLGGGMMVTPTLDENYWAYRVKLSNKQAVVGFPKFGTIGIGFAVEDDNWNTNLPAGEAAESIAAHIAVNKGDDKIDDADVVAAIRLIQQAVDADRIGGQ